MTTRELLEKLVSQRNKINLTIEMIESVESSRIKSVKRKQIIKSTKKKHWTQKPENKIRLKKLLKKMEMARRKK